MQVSTSPTLVPLPFADSGSKNVIPEAASPTPGLASLTTGFPPVTMTPLAAGGIPPAGQDMNGILNLITQTTRWNQAGGPFAYNSGFATDANVNGYPQGATISRADYTGQWISTVDNNTVNPDTVGTGWVPGYNYGTTAISGLTNANVTLTPAQAAKNRVTLAGTLTGNVQIIFPVWTKDWTIVNNTTGAFTVTCKTSAGTGIAIPQNSSPTRVTGDGTNIIQLPENIAPATQSGHAVQLGQMNAALLGASSIVSISTATTLTSANAGQQIAITAAVAATLPAASTVKAGQAIQFVSSIAGASVARAGSDTITSGASSLTSVGLNVGDSVLLESNGSNAWSLVSQNLSSQTTLAAAGYRKFPAYAGDPSPLIIQWGIATAGGAGTTPVTFPIAFPAVCYNVTVNPAYGGSGTPGAATAAYGALTTTGFNIGSTTSFSCNWTALGR